MWLYLIAIVLLAAGIIGGFATGGIFTIILIPLGVITLLVAGGSGLAARSASRRGVSADPGDPLPHSTSSGGGRVPASPEGLAGARRAQQQGARCGPIPTCAPA